MKTINNTLELTGMIRLLIVQYSEYQNSIDENVKLTFTIEFSEDSKDYKVTFTWIEDLKLVHCDPETSHKEYDEIHGKESFIINETESLIKLEQYVSDCLNPVSQTNLYQ